MGGKGGAGTDQDRRCDHLGAPRGFVLLQHTTEHTLVSPHILACLALPVCTCYVCRPTH